ncbi:arsenate-mycothiol transferase ArsC [Rhodopirellula sallentina]|uniref:arsenate-mycothiol transferase ArsC n=1 Tax=Rhodopirellula sallentina TaxID=1263869 RepID=UPI000347F188|nr:protein tyrosine phosphatase [Rhodopirellula sallentina]
MNECTTVHDSILRFIGETDWQKLKQTLPEERRELVTKLVDCAETRIRESRPLRLTFICTHNSRRSQLAQVWAQTAAAYFGLTREDVLCFSGGTEATACNRRTVEALRRSGFVVTETSLSPDVVGETDNVGDPANVREPDSVGEPGSVGEIAKDNVPYEVSFGEQHPAIECFSKVYNQSHNPNTQYVAVMCCDHADQNCPVVFGATDRIAMWYVDPKAFDGTDRESAAYDERNLQVAREMWSAMGELAQRLQ